METKPQTRRIGAAFWTCRWSYRVWRHHLRAGGRIRRARITMEARRPTSMSFLTVIDLRIHRKNPAFRSTTISAITVVGIRFAITLRSLHLRFLGNGSRFVDCRGHPDYTAGAD